MHKKIINLLILTSISCFFLFILNCLKEVIPEEETLTFNKATVLAEMKLANDYYSAKNPYNARVDSSHVGNIWTKSTYLEGVMAYYRITNYASLYEYAMNWSNYFNWNAQSGNTTTNPIDQCCMQTYCELYQIKSSVSNISNVKTCMDRAIASKF